jgi:hypothetical protein
MGIRLDDVHFLRYCKKNGVDFEDTCQIGRQNCFFSQKEIGVEYGDFAESLFRSLGAKSVESVDYSGYENASMIHDMNLPIVESFKDRFSVVVDGGTLEHVFNYSVAIKNCMEMVKIGGHLILMTPANNHFGHGFYQFSPELFFSLLDEQNGFAETQIFIQDDFLQWYKIKNPKDLKSRINVCCTNESCIICVVSKKFNATPEKLTVLQSDYVDLWQSGNKPIYKDNYGGYWKISIKSFVKKIIPNSILCKIRKCKQKKKENARKEIFYEKVNLGNLFEESL